MHQGFPGSSTPSNAKPDGRPPKNIQPISFQVKPFRDVEINGGRDSNSRFLLHPFGLTDVGVAAIRSKCREDILVVPANSTRGRNWKDNWKRRPKVR